MDHFSTSTRQPGVEQRPRGSFMNSVLMVRNSGMALLAMLLAVTFANLVCG
jgi:hypothetical protein